MSHSGARAGTLLDMWREQHADRLDPVRFHFMVALERRAASHDGEVRRLLDDRLSKLLDSYAADLANAVTSNTATSCVPAAGALGALVDYLASCSATRGDELPAGGGTPLAASYPELAALDAFRKIWSKLRTDGHLRQSLKPVPANAGPLNSGALAHRSIALMRELSPGYLQHFLSYVDDLSWIERLNDARAWSAKDAPRAASTRKRAKAKPRTP
ncbi:DUF2894 domain-containing protein [Dyella humicola]|uniref:DUF2894 domain-containing protein n=1 Tax=Dyella humicola TaxID=2992126 RepID=UPI00224DE70C|nr:DUF2894 domain-containing protein [Dyella humicola]